MYGTSGNYYYDEHDAKRDEYLKRQAEVMGNKVMLLFKLTIFSIVMVLASIVVMLFIAVYTVMYGGSEQIVLYVVFVPCLSLNPNCPWELRTMLKYGPNLMTWNKSF